MPLGCRLMFAFGVAVALLLFLLGSFDSLLAATA
jgi:hypothetical protein